MPQFLLTAAEYEALVPKAELDKARADFAKTSRLVAKLTRGNCINDEDGDGGYCDNCGMGNFENDMPRCPFPRNFSK